MPQNFPLRVISLRKFVNFDGFVEVSLLSGEVPTLYGETQALDGFDSSDDEEDGSINEWGKTQLVDTYEETAAVDSSGEGTDCTEVLSGDEEGVSDDGAISCGDGKNDGVVDTGAEMRMIGGDNLSTAQEKNDDVVDSDASTDDGGVDDDDDTGWFHLYPFFQSISWLFSYPMIFLGCLDFP